MIDEYDLVVWALVVATMAAITCFLFAIAFN